MTPEPDPIRAAGVVCLRRNHDGGSEVLLVHRTRRDDWSLPKGKLEPGEHVAAAAVRETAEETGYEVVLGPPLTRQQYLVEDRPKTVSYWCAHAVGRGAWSPNIEVDRVRWVPVDVAGALLSYAHDEALVDEAMSVPTDTLPFVLLRHAQAEKRDSFAERHRGKPPADGERPLSRVGEAQAMDLVPVLEAFGITAVHSSDAVRCMTTVEPYAQEHGSTVVAEEYLSETGYESRPRLALRRIDELLQSTEPIVLCTHRPVLPDVVRRIQKVTGCRGLPRAMAPGGFVVLHRRLEGERVRVVAIEPHEP